MNENIAYIKETLDTMSNDIDEIRSDLVAILPNEDWKNTARECGDEESY